MNFFGLVRLTKAFLPAMRAQGSGAIVNIGSLTGTFPPPFQSAYAATKLCLEAFTKSLRQELGRRGVRVSMVIPGYIRTYIEPRTIVPEAAFTRTSSPPSARPGIKKWTRPRRSESAARKILKVMEKKNPGPVYYTGHLVPVMGFLKRVLPERTAQQMIRSFYKLDR